MVESLGLELTDAQKFQAKLRGEQVTAAVLAAEYPLSKESAPRAYANYLALQKQLGIQPPTPAYQRRVGIDQMMKLIERLEIDVMKDKLARAKYEALRAHVDADSLGLRVEPTPTPKWRLGSPGSSAAPWPSASSPSRPRVSGWKRI